MKRVQLVRDTFSFEPCEKYEEIALLYGFSVKLVAKSTCLFTFRNIGEVIGWVFGSTNGGFDPKFVDTARLEEFKRPFGNYRL